jgi:hypothetical protein
MDMLLGTCAQHFYCVDLQILRLLNKDLKGGQALPPALRIAAKSQNPDGCIKPLIRIQETTMSLLHITDVYQNLEGKAARKRHGYGFARSDALGDVKLTDERGTHL